MMLKVIGAGLGRTGTHSLARALEMLGFGPCYTIHELGKNPDHVDIWNEAINGKRVDWKTLYQGYQSAVDWPTVSFLPQLLSEYPEAKVVLTLRDPEGWYESARATIFRGLELSVHNPNPSSKKSSAMKRCLILEGMFSNKHHDRDHAIDVFKRHTRKVIELVPPNPLLEYRVTESWEPLCEFLDTPVPNAPFPKVNDRASFLSTTPDWAKKLADD